MYSLAFFTFYGYITNSQSDQLLDGLIAQSVEHCTGIAEVMGSNPVQAAVFFQAVCINAMINRKFISFSAVEIYDLTYSFGNFHKSVTSLFQQQVCLALVVTLEEMDCASVATLSPSF